MTRDDLEAALARKLAGRAPAGVVILFDLGPDGTITLDGTASPPGIRPAGPAPNTTIKLSAADLAEMLDGTLNPMDAYMQGRLDIDGDTAPAMALGTMLG